MGAGREGSGAVPTWPSGVALADSAVLGIALVDASGRILAANAALHELLHRAVGSLVGSDITALFASGTAASPSVAAAVAEVLRGGLGPRTVRVQLATGSTWADATVTASAAGTALVQVTDVTPLVRAEEDRDRAHELVTLLSQISTDIVARLDVSGAITWISPAVERVLGWDPGALTGSPLAEITAPADREALDLALASEPPGQAEVRLRSTTGSYRLLAVTTHGLPGVGSGTGLLVGLRDVTEVRRAQERLARSAAQFRTAMQGAPDGIAVTDAHDRIVQANPALADLLGRPIDSLLNHRFREFTPPADRDRVDGMIAQLQDSGADSVRLEHALTTDRAAPDLGDEAGQLWVDHSVAVLRAERGETMFVHQFADRTAARRLQEELQFQATHDMDTGLEKRHSLMSGLEQRLGVHAPAEQHVGVLWCDIDQFKSVNDEFGHRTGDRVIAEVAERLRGAVRQHDRVGRVGGDEFVVVLEHCPNEEDLRTVAEHVRTAVSLPVQVGGRSIPVTLSVGAILADASGTPDQVLTRADEAMYRAKRSGGNRIVVETPAVRTPGPPAAQPGDSPVVEESGQDARPT